MLTQYHNPYETPETQSICEGVAFFQTDIRTA